MQTEKHGDDSVLALTTTVGRLLVEERFGDALSALQEFVERVIFDPASIARVFASAELDELCKLVAATRVGDAGAWSAGVEGHGTVVLVSELSKAGGHNELVRDIIRLELFPAPLRIVQTDCFQRSDESIATAFAGETGVSVERAAGRDAGEKFSWFIDFLDAARPANLLLLAHNQDALAIAAAFAAKAKSADLQVVYVHHGDHHLSLGAATRDFVHVDPHNIGYFHCRDALGHHGNHYWPLTADVGDVVHRRAPFMTTGRLVTCTSGRIEKFESGSYRYDYFELLPRLLQASGGVHVHIGDIPPERMGSVERALRAVDVDPSRFVHVPWVKSVARALIEHGVDLYISSFPLGGGKATLEAMAAGIPLLMHRSYRSRFHGGEDIAYPDAFVWRTADELLRIVETVDADDLAAHSARARRHYETFHAEAILAASCDFDAPQDESIIPPLKDYRSDPLEVFFDDVRRRTAQQAASRQEIDRQADELRSYETQSQAFQDQLTGMTQKATLLEETLMRSTASFEQKIGRNLQEIEKDRVDIERYRAIFNDHVREIETCRRELDAHLEQQKRDRQERDDRRRSLEESLRSAENDRKSLSDHREEIVRCTQRIAELEALCASKDGAVSRLRSEVRDLRSSTSWRATRPLRYLSRVLRPGGANVDGVAPGTVPAIPAIPAVASVDAVRTAAEHVAVQAAPAVPPSGLPDDFIPQVYLKLNPDLLAAGVDAGAHFLSHGQREGRRYALPEFVVKRSPGFDASLPTVLLVSHEASRTGAPILSLNLVQSLSRRYNVVALLLGGGVLKPAFEETGATVLIASAVRGSHFVAHYVVGQVCDAFDLRFALVNSIESRHVLPALAERFVPAITLIHEFASYTRPKDAFREALQWSSEVVFSANVTRDNAFATFPELARTAAIVLPQGKCVLPTSAHDIQGEELEARRLRETIRPKGSDDVLIVLGAGFVQLRKGVDLFIDCAARVKRRAGAHKVRFVWIGNGYEPETDVAYSAYLQDQLRRADLSDDLVFLGETSAIEAAYGSADLLLLSSRLDPLPNVAIDAMAQGVPVLCFEKTTGIADFLHDAGLGPRCVAAYLDTEDAARKILDFAASPALIAEVGAVCRQRSVEYFDMARYVERIESLAGDTRSRVRQEAVDARTIAESGLLRTDFADLPDDAPVDAMARRYVRTWASGIGRRKPFPGFHPGIYLEQHGVETPGSDPLADYLRRGRPTGAWNYPVIVPGDRSPVTATATATAEHRVALHVHAYYVDLLPDILERLAANRRRPDLFISVANEEALLAAQAHVQSYDGRTVDIRIVPNRGRDIGPFFTGFFDAIRDAYDIVGHVHTKKSLDVSDGNVGKRWFRFLVTHLLGDGSHGMVDAIVDRMLSDPSIGMVFPDEPYISGMEANRPFAQALGERLGIPHIPEYFLFPVGTMFWARTAALQPVGDLGLTWDDYPPEPLPYDGSMLHAMERLIALALPTRSWTLATCNVKGVTR